MAIDLKKLELAFDALFSEPEIEETFWDWYTERKKVAASSPKEGVALPEDWWTKEPFLTEDAIRGILFKYSDSDEEGRWLYDSSFEQVVADMMAKIVKPLQQPYTAAPSPDAGQAIAFAEWADENYFRLGNSNRWTDMLGEDERTEYTTAELYKLFQDTTSTNSGGE